MEFQLSYFKSWKMMVWKCCTQYANKYGKLSSGHRTGKGQFSFQSQRKAMPKNAQLPHNCTHLTASKVMLKILQARLQQYMSQELPNVKQNLEKAEEPEIKLPTSDGSLKKQESSKKNLLLLYWLCQSLWLCGPQQTVENSSRDGNTRPPGLTLEKSVCRSRSNN